MYEYRYCTWNWTWTRSTIWFLPSSRHKKLTHQDCYFFTCHGIPTTLSVVVVAMLWWSRAQLWHVDYCRIMLIGLLKRLNLFSLPQKDRDVEECRICFPNFCYPHRERGPAVLSAVCMLRCCQLWKKGTALTSKVFLLMYVFCNWNIQEISSKYNLWRHICC